MDNSGAEPRAAHHVRSPRPLVRAVSGIVVVLLVAATRAMLQANPSAVPRRSAPRVPRLAPATTISSPRRTLLAPRVLADLSASAMRPGTPRVRTTEGTRAEARAAAFDSVPVLAPRTLLSNDPARVPARPLSWRRVPAPSGGSVRADVVSPAGQLPRASNWQTLMTWPGVQLEGAAVTDASSGTGAMRAARALRTHTDVTLTIDMDSLAGWPGLTLLAQVKDKRGRDGSSESAVLQSFSNIDAGDFQALGEVFIEQHVWQERLRLKLGRMDFNSDFAATEQGAEFLNASMGFSPSITAAPTYPLPSLGLAVQVKPLERVTLGLGVFDGMNGAPAPNGGTSHFAIGQMDLSWSTDQPARTGRLGVGAFRHSGVFSRVGTSSAAELPGGGILPDAAIAGATGWFATVDQTLWQHPKSQDGDAPHTVAGFVQLGWSDPRVDAIHTHIGGGVTFADITPLPSSLLGVAATHAVWHGGRETIGEAYHRFALSGVLSVMVDVQRVYQRSDAGGRRIGNIFSVRTILAVW